ncbi:hypothetical protein BJ138DRAFT_1076053 [Hygrophoropsis aurantiaca]|uniref:Uncharacterized protein n=1 Tax=Hygrophoropsis aurantiaca TaxID=72124 RepID=A0ACB8AT44_9AGAM|nr:hypothetical protein BJ138DRAFT_1076053 [Hygrophoropsis aurantiaca]
MAPISVSSRVDSISDTVMQAQLLIDKELEELNDRMRILRTRRNAISKISFLPDELLAMIFMHHATQLYIEFCNNQDSFSFLSAPLQWIQVAHVCHHWRQVALLYPSLWTLLVFKSPRWTEEMLERSKMAPLIIDINLTYMTPKVVSGVQTALTHVGRVRELRLVSSKETLEKLLTPISAIPALHMESIYIFTTHHHIRIDNYSLPETLFGGELPRLRNLSLFGCDVVWGSPIFNGLTHLNISDLSMSVRSKTAQFFATLNLMPALRTLILKDALPLTPVTPSDRSPTTVQDMLVALPALDSISLDGAVIDCAFLLAHLIYPRTTSLNLRCRVHGSNLSNLYSIISRMETTNGIDGSDTTPFSKQAPLQSMLIRTALNESTSTAFIQCSTSVQPPLFHWASLPSIPDSVRNDHFPLTLALLWESGGHLMPDVLSNVCAALPLSRVCHIDSQGSYPLPENIWLEGFRNACQLEKLSLSHTPICGLIKSWISVESGTATFAPALKSIRLQHIEFDETDAPEVERFRGADPLTLLNALKLRANQGIPIKELIIENCSNIFAEDIRLLKDIVPRLQWDSIERHSFNVADEEEDDDDDSDILYDYENGGFLYGHPYGMGDETDAF